MPRSSRTSRKLEVFTVSAHYGASDNKAVNYQRLFQAVSETSRAQRAISVLGKSVALPEFRVDENIVVLTAYEGEEGNPLFFNFVNATERIEELPRGEKLATKTHGVINIATREAVVEYNQRGAKASDIAEAIQEIGRKLTGWTDLEVEFSPVVEQSFVQAINSFDRIREATVKMVRPNQDWTDHATYLTDLAKDSKAHLIEVTANAQRAQSLNQSKGIIGFIKRIINAPKSSLKSAKVTGTRAGEEAETTVSTSNHIAHQRVNVEMTKDGLVSDPDINNRLVRFAEGRDPRNQK
jgi:hypothetical protein